jgi:uncharacterized membrane protein YhaH (DUF805 family)
MQPPFSSLQDHLSYVQIFSSESSYVYVILCIIIIIIILATITEPLRIQRQAESALLIVTVSDVT